MNEVCEENEKESVPFPMVKYLGQIIELFKPIEEEAKEEERFLCVCFDCVCVCVCRYVCM